MSDILERKDEILAALRCCAKHDGSCFECEREGTAACLVRMGGDATAADLIEALSAQLEQVTAERDTLKQNFIDCVCDGIYDAAPYCVNSSSDCTDEYGFCKNDGLCKGFIPDMKPEESDVSE